VITMASQILIPDEEWLQASPLLVPRFAGLQGAECKSFLHLSRADASPAPKLRPCVPCAVYKLHLASENLYVACIGVRLVTTVRFLTRTELASSGIVNTLVVCSAQSVPFASRQLKFEGAIPKRMRGEWKKRGGERDTL
jgi:hypothetical protein